LSASSQTSPLFYMYEEAALNHAFLRHCPRFRELRLASKAENTAEVGLYRALARHPRRTRDPTLARLFYLPIFEYSSNFVDGCNGSDLGLPAGLGSHRARMAAARDALLASPHFRAHGGRDHVWASTAFSAHGYSMASRMSPLSSLLGCSAVGRYKAGPFTRSSAVGSCVVQVPYQASLHAMGAWRARAPPPQSLLAETMAAVETAGATGGSAASSGGSAASSGGSAASSGGSAASSGGSAASSGGSAASSHKTLLFFAGSLDVCCTGKQIRCAIVDLHEASLHLPDVIIRPTGGGLCTRKALRNADNFTTIGGGASRGSPTSGNGTLTVSDSSPHAAAAAVVPTISGSARYVKQTVVALTAREMSASTFCLCPAGDTCITSRVYTAVAAGCIPIILCDGFVGAYNGVIDYRAFSLKWPTKKFFEAPTALLSQLRSIAANASIMARMQGALRDARADLLYDEPESRVGTRFLDEVVARCPLPPSPQLPTPRPQQESSCLPSGAVGHGAGVGGGGGGAMNVASRGGPGRVHRAEEPDHAGRHHTLSSSLKPTKPSRAKPKGKTVSNSTSDRTSFCQRPSRPKPKSS
jgi:hypothetical protein